MSDDAYPLWISTYTSLLIRRGIAPVDAAVSIRLGFLIGALDETCFGAQDVALVNFLPLPADHPSSKLFASYQVGDSYLVYPTLMATKIAHLMVGMPTSGSVPAKMECLLASIAAHEVRHRIQMKRPQTILYDRTTRRWHRGILGSVMEAAHRELEVAERNTTAEYIKRACLTEEQLFGSNEYDATVVEHLVRERCFSAQVTEVASITCANAPRPRISEV